MFKGQFIYWGIGSILTGLLLCMVFSSVFNLLTGIATLAVISGGGLSLTAMQQKKGLHSKTTFPGIFIHQTKYQKHDKN